MAGACLQANGMEPGFLVGGVPQNFGVSARLGRLQPDAWLPSGLGNVFVIEADEYDTAFFDKRSKFVHYRPRTAILNNLEYDHPDIFPDLTAIEVQFHHLVRTVAGQGRIVINGMQESLQRVIERGCWSEQAWFGHTPGSMLNTEQLPQWTYKGTAEHFDVFKTGNLPGRLNGRCLVNTSNSMPLPPCAAEHVVLLPGGCTAWPPFECQTPYGAEGTVSNSPFTMILPTILRPSAPPLTACTINRAAGPAVSWPYLNHAPIP